MEPRAHLGVASFGAGRLGAQVLLGREAEDQLVQERGVGQDAASRPTTGMAWILSGPLFSAASFTASCH